MLLTIAAVWYLVGLVSLILFAIGLDIDDGEKLECPTYKEVVQIILLSMGGVVWAFLALRVFVKLGWNWLFNDYNPSSWWNKKLCGDK